MLVNPSGDQSALRKAPRLDQIRFPALYASTGQGLLPQQGIGDRHHHGEHACQSDVHLGSDLRQF